MVHKVLAFTLPLALFILFVSGCNVGKKTEAAEEEPSEVDLTTIFPPYLPPVEKAIPMELDGQEGSEWLVFYRVDLVQGNRDRSPIAAAVYRPALSQDMRRPPSLVPAPLWLPDQGYLCLYSCQAAAEDVIGASPGDELIVRDTRDGELVGVAIFAWDAQLPLETGAGGEPARGAFRPLGHFRGDRVTVERPRPEQPGQPEQVTVEHWQRDRSNLAIRSVYQPRDGRFYLTPATDGAILDAQLRPPVKVQVVFAVAPPEDPLKAIHPEKLVMAYYLNYRDEAAVNGYFSTPDALARTEAACGNTVCGCRSGRNNLSEVLVKEIGYDGTPEASTQVTVKVECISGNDPAGAISSVTWALQRNEDFTWRLSGASVASP